MPQSLSELPQALRDRLTKIESEIQCDKVTISFSLEERDASGCRKSAFCSVSSSRSLESSSQGWSLAELKIVSAVLSKHVVMATYRDAVYRKMLSQQTANSELKSILERYDASLAALLVKEMGDG